MKLTCATREQVKADALVVGVTTIKDKRSAPGLKVFGEHANKHANWLLGNQTTSLGAKSVQSVPGDKNEAVVVLVGLGDPAKLTQEQLGACLHAALKHVKGLGFSNVATTLVTDAMAKDGLSEELATRALTHGALIGNLSFDQWKSKPKGKDAKKPQAAVKSLQLVHEKPAKIRQIASNEAIIAEAVNDARLLANTPANIATPKWMAAQARARGRKYGFKVNVKGRSQLRREGYGAMCGVAQGSSNEEQLIVMEYAPAKVTKSTKTLAIVGKGVCFDSGGISLKPGHGMWDMKYDKCGACNTIALMGAVARLKPNHKIVGITPCVENMPSGTAQRPGDIVSAKNGTTIEILNTDAEGRLILADAVFEATKHKPKWIIEMSTLTGACEIAVGSTYVAVMSKDDEFASSIVAVARTAGDKAWQLPQGEEFDEANKGTYADMQNISLTSKAGTSIGGSFVGHFAGDTTFAHLDIASKAWTGGVDYFAKGPTGAGLRIALARILAE